MEDMPQGQKSSSSILQIQVLKEHPLCGLSVTISCGRAAAETQGGCMLQQV